MNFEIIRIFHAGRWQRITRIMLCLVLCTIAFSGSAAKRQLLPKVLILTGNGNLPQQRDYYPPWIHEFQNDEVIHILKGIAEVDTTADLADLNKNTLSKYDLLISNSMFLNPDNDQLEALHDFVKGGKSFLTLHCGILSFLDWEKYESFIGGVFIGGPSSEPQRFKVYTSNNEFWGYRYPFRNNEQHPVSKATADFEIEDELYYFQPSTSEIAIIARAENHPVMWWHPVGSGKVMSLTLGHGLDAKRNPGYQELLRNGVRWLLGYPLIVLNGIKNISTRSLTYKGFMAELFPDVAEDIRLTYTVKNPATIFKIVPVGQDRHDLLLNGDVGSAPFTISAKNACGMTTEREVVLNVVEDGTGNIAAYYGNTITGTDAENDSDLFSIENIIDDDMTSWWSSKKTEQASIVLDLQKAYHVKQVCIHWESAYATVYDLLVSLDGEEWLTVNAVDKGVGGKEILRLAGLQARFIKLELKEKVVGRNGYSIYEIQVSE